MKTSGGRNVFRDFTGQKFGLLTAIRRTEASYLLSSGRRERKWILRCECGREVTRTRQNLVRSKTCGEPECRIPWIANVYAEKRKSKPENTLTSWQRLQKELKHLRIENAKLLQQLSERR